MTIFEFGDIVLVPFPFTDQSRRKQRPAVIVSSNLYQRRRPKDKQKLDSVLKELLGPAG